MMTSNEDENAMRPNPEHHDESPPKRRDAVSIAEAEREAYFRYAEAEREAYCRYQNSLSDAQRSAIRTAMFGPLPFIAMVVVGWTMSLREHGFTPTTMTQRIETLLALLFAVVVSGIVCAVMVGLVTGGLAHRIAFETTVPVSRLAIALAWVVNLTVWGWWLVLVCGPGIP